MKTNKAVQDTRGSVQVNGVTIGWSDSRYMGSDADDPTGDFDLRGVYEVRVSVEDGEIDAIGHAIACAKRLKALSTHCDVLCPVRGSQHVLRLAGLDDGGVPVWRVVMGDRECDAISASVLAQMDPSDYTQSGETAMQTIAWMRAVGRITSGWHTPDEVAHVLRHWDAATKDAAKLQFCRDAAQSITSA